MGHNYLHRLTDNIDRSGVSLDSVIVFYPIGPCPKCNANFWSKDQEYRLRSGKERFYCFYCGADYYPDAPAYKNAVGTSEQELNFV